MNRGFAGPQGALKLEGPKWRQGGPHIKQPAGGSPGALASLGEAAPSLKDNSLEGTQLEQPAGNTWTECLCPEEVIWEHTKAFTTVPLRLQVPESICQQPGTIVQSQGTVCSSYDTHSKASRFWIHEQVAAHA